MKGEEGGDGAGGGEVGEDWSERVISFAGGGCTIPVTGSKR